MVWLNNYKVIFLFFNLLAFSCPFTFANQDGAFSFFPSLSAAEKQPYTNWLDDKASYYDRHTFLPSKADADLGAAVLWKIDETNEMITFAVAVKATGWLGFGISEAGGMLGSDIVLFRASDNSLVDSHVLEAFYPIADDCQNWNLVSSSTDDGWIMIETSRKLDTGDRQDHKILNDEMPWVASSRLISAWGNTVDVGYHFDRRSSKAVRLFGNDSSTTSSEALQVVLEARSDGYFEVREANYEIPTQTTTYHRFCVTFNEISTQLQLPQDQTMLTMLGAMPVISEETAPHVHHFTSYTVASCDNIYVAEHSLIYGWAPGSDGFALPEGVGMPIFDSNNRQALMLEIHYDNPGGAEGKLDSSGLRFYYSLEEQSQNAGLLQLADPFAEMRGKKIPNGLSEYEFSCSGGCSNLFLDNEGVTVLTEYLHMHKTGVLMTNEVIRSGNVVHTSRVDVFEFAQQGTFHAPISSSYQIYPGDAFRTTCYYRDGSEFGLGSDEEMCVAYVLYYPAKYVDEFPWTCPYNPPYIKDSICTSEVSDRTLSGDADLDRVFGGSNECPITASDRPTTSPSSKPSLGPTVMRSDGPSSSPTAKPSFLPSWNPSSDPTIKASEVPTTSPSSKPSLRPTVMRSDAPSVKPSSSPGIPSLQPTATPFDIPTVSCLASFTPCSNHFECCSNICLAGKCYRERKSPRPSTGKTKFAYVRGGGRRRGGLRGL